MTNLSLCFGYEIAKAEEWGKPILALFRDESDRKLSAMIEASANTKTIYHPSLTDAKLAIDNFIVELQQENMN